MKKIFLLSLSFFTVKLNAQLSLKNPYVYTNGYWADGKKHYATIPYIDTLRLNQKDAVRVVDKPTKYGDFNVLLLNKSINKSIDSSLLGFFDSTTNNTYKKIDDTTYEIDIRNLSKNVLIVYDNKSNYMTSTNETLSDMPTVKGGLDAPDFMGLGVKNVQFSFDDITHDYSNIISINPLKEYTIEFGKTKSDYSPTNVIRRFIIKPILPKPVLINVFTESSALWAINDKKANPGYDFGGTSNLDIPYLNAMKINRDAALRENKHTLLFAFAHFGGLLRNDKMDLIQYKLDTSTQWSLTSLSNSPSVLLENLSVGKHTLYARYPSVSGNSEILKINWEITPP
ncbi:hypothetical protein A9P82_06600 [Arachidicoccus ginsenosidimutans]|uniref:hypothetical protein n=1 Tax=Arachidicoccus sp. BS20 TaxID=1850526 RepID=UPI0007F14E64|nr:hypothetical protein [Arachidicoccus sp. BS20]ANI88992.1 hypothetical protein A9P82_06600 [Arachidicoccus sp. BS20]